MKRIWDVFVLTLAINFVAAATIVGVLWGKGHLDRQRVARIREVMFPPPAKQPAAKQPAEDPTTQPAFRLQQLLARRAVLPGTQPEEFTREKFDIQMAELDRRQRELNDLKAQLDLANEKMIADRAALDADRQKLAAETAQADKLAGDQGFQNSLALYTSMPARQVKAIFLTLDEQTVKQYLEAMPPRSAARVIREFKSPAEIERIHRIMETMRQGQPATQETSQ